MMIKKSTTTIFCCKGSFISKKKIAFKNFIETFHFVKFSTKENHFYFFFLYKTIFIKIYNMKI